MRRALVLIGSACALGLSFRACGGDDNATDGSVDAGDEGEASLVDTLPPYDIVAPDVVWLPDIDGGPMCNPGKAFGAPVPVSELDTTGTEASLRLSYDLLSGYFASMRDGGLGSVDLWLATRPDAATTFGIATNLTTLNSPQIDTHASVTSDGLTLVYESSRNTPSASILFSTRASASTDFGAPLALLGLGSFAVVADPFVRADGKVLYFVAGNTAADLDIYRAGQDSSLGYTGGTSVGEINSQGQESLPTVSPNDRLIYFASNRIDGGSKGGFDIWLATRPSLNDPFSAPALVPELNTNDDDFPDFIAPDGCTLWMHRNVTSSDGGQAKVIYVATKSM